MERKLTELELVRRAKLEKYKEMGVNPYSRRVDYEDNSVSLKEKYDQYTKEELHEKKFTTSTVFRIMNARGPFLAGKDSKGTVQAYIGKDFDANVIALKETLDIGDIIRVEGEVMKTNTGELTVRGEKLELITKSLRPLPEKFHGLKDVEERYRRRYVDLIMNDEVKQTF